MERIVAIIIYEGHINIHILITLSMHLLNEDKEVFTFSFSCRAAQTSKENSGFVLSPMGAYGMSKVTFDLFSFP